MDDNLIVAIRRNRDLRPNTRAEMTANILAVEEQDLVAHVFAPMDGPLASEARAQIRRLWSNCGVSLGMTEPIPLRNLAIALPDDLLELPEVAVVAGRQSPGAAFQAVLRRDHDVLNLSVLLACQNGSGSSRPLWPELDRLWRQASDAGTRSLIGSALLYLAKVADPTRVGQEMEGRLPSAPAAGWRRTELHASARLSAWEISTRDDVRTDRQFVIVARPNDDAELSAWTWSNGDSTMPPFARYLMHMAKIRYELRVLADSPSAALLCQDTDDAIAEIRELVSAAIEGTLRGADRLLLASGLAALQRNGVELAEMSMRLKAMRRTAEIAQANALDSLGADLRANPREDFVADDRAVALSLIQRVDDDIAYLAVSLEGVHQVRELAGGLIGEQALAAPSRRQGTAVVLCALNVEYLAVQAHLTGLRDLDHPAGTRFEAGRLASSNWQVVLAATGPGNVGAAVIAERAISLFSPDVLLCVGVAGSLKEDINLGDIVVATRVDAYQGGTAAEDFLARPRTWPAPHRLEQAARALDRTGRWRQRLPAAAGDTAIAVHFRPIAAGEIVLDSRHVALFAQLHLHNNDAAAIEMEGAGIAQAAHFNDSLPALVIRGISDQADGTKVAADQKGWQQLASVNAAAFAASLLEDLIPPGRPVGQ
jgi:nucleoside phosphorylase